MDDLIQELKQEHRQILAHLEAIRQTHFVRDKAARELAQAKALIIAHLAKEDARLYGPLLANAGSAGVAAGFQERMRGISPEVLAFFDQYDLSKATELGTDFVRDLGMLIGKLKTRIEQEEAKLYPLYQQFAV